MWEAGRESAGSRDEGDRRGLLGRSMYSIALSLVVIRLKADRTSLYRADYAPRNCHAGTRYSSAKDRGSASALAFSQRQDSPNRDSTSIGNEDTTLGQGELTPASSVVKARG